MVGRKSDQNVRVDILTRFQEAGLGWTGPRSLVRLS